MTQCLNLAIRSTTTGSSDGSGPAAWARSSWPSTRPSAVASRSSCCRWSWPAIRRSASGSSARRGWPPGSITPTWSPSTTRAAGRPASGWRCATSPARTCASGCGAPAAGSRPRSPCRSSSRSPRPSTTPTRTGSSIATSSPPTSCSRTRPPPSRALRGLRSPRPAGCCWPTSA
ncbi:hypothetical protein PAI11_42010 [Patulibacter medicamentivorans]|uniref:Uncharacterized protein n=1 Tax=Patulibacter medicamentivorans TaxID=1097667 RepID=H0EBH2_9ACTN|nr:hypothetical protein PAI11_42010 [Patulibacter medicamentivorans]